MQIVARQFTISGEGGTAIYPEGHTVSEDIAKRFPQFMEGYVAPKTVPHNPNLPQKLSKTAAAKLSEEELMQWIRQYHPGSVPSGKPEKAELAALVMQLQD